MIVMSASSKTFGQQGVRQFDKPLSRGLFKIIERFCKSAHNLEKGRRSNSKTKKEFHVNLFFQRTIQESILWKGTCPNLWCQNTCNLLLTQKGLLEIKGEVISLLMNELQKIESGNAIAIRTVEIEFDSVLK